MDKNVKLSAQRLAVQSLPRDVNAGHPAEHQMEFHAIVTCRYTAKVLDAINIMDDGRVSGAAFRMFFFLELPFNAGCSYDCIMDRVQEHVIEIAVTASGLNAEDVTEISVAANWSNWEAVTGRIYNDEASTSKVAPNGEMFLPSFYRQIEECGVRGETTNDLVWKALAEHYGHPLKAA